MFTVSCVASYKTEGFDAENDGGVACCITQSSSSSAARSSTTSSPTVASPAVGSCAGSSSGSGLPGEDRSSSFAERPVPDTSPF